MPDFDEMTQITRLAELLASMPAQQPGGPRIPFGIPAKRVQWATELVRDYGVRVFPNLATKELVVDTPAGAAEAGVAAMANLGSNFTPRRAIDKLDASFMLNLLRSAGEVPGLVRLADEIESALGDPAAETAVLEKISREQPDVIATATRQYRQYMASLKQQAEQDAESSE